MSGEEEEDDGEIVHNNVLREYTWFFVTVDNVTSFLQADYT